MDNNIFQKIYRIIINPLFYGAFNCTMYFDCDITVFYNVATCRRFFEDAVYTNSQNEQHFTMI